MLKANIDTLISLLQEAKMKGCKKVKLQLYDNWEDIVKEQKNPAQKPEEYLVDARFYNTVEFDTEIKNKEATDRIITKIDGDTLIIKVTLSDRESLLKNLGIEQFYEK